MWKRYDDLRELHQRERLIDAALLGFAFGVLLTINVGMASLALGQWIGGVL